MASPPWPWLFVVPLLESSAFVGFVFPGEIAVLLGGVLAFQHRVSLPAVLAAAIAGAVIGDTVGYAVGHRYGRRLLSGRTGRTAAGWRSRRSPAGHGGGRGPLCGRERRWALLRGHAPMSPPRR
jgi:membrane protein YqaA with SNARE-associated domain